MSIRLPGVRIEQERDVVVSRQRARRLAELLGFDKREQTRIATAVSEIARNAYAYAGGGRVEFEVEGDSRPQLFVVPPVVNIERARRRGSVAIVVAFTSSLNNRLADHVRTHWPLRP